VEEQDAQFLFQCMEPRGDIRLDRVQLRRRSCHDTRFRYSGKHFQIAHIHEPSLPVSRFPADCSADIPSRALTNRAHRCMPGRQFARVGIWSNDRSYQNKSFQMLD
jgi:hypothetical protein